jgi:DeoR/GlpR family transcriptional regulator of sugar metabolism
MIKVAKEVILLADHAKFGKAALISFASLNQIHKIVTDQNAPQDMIVQLEAQGIEVIIARDG